MKDHLQNIRNQIHQCEKLLHVYQKEHRLLLSDDCQDLSDMSPIVEMKMRLMRTFDLQQKFITTLESETDAVDIESRELLRELSRRIEQLLVLDRENELLLRRLLHAESNRDTRVPAYRTDAVAGSRSSRSKKHEAAHA